MTRPFGLRARFLLVALAVYLTTGAIAFVALRNVVGRVTEHLGLAYAGKYALASSAILREPLDRELTLARLMADSPTIQNWIAAEKNEDRQAEAFAELENYRRRFGERSWFLVVNPSLRYYFDDETHRYGDSKFAYALTPGKPEDQWYFATLESVPDFALNVNYDRVLDAHKVWINVVMRAPDGAPLGVTGTGLDLSEFLRLTVDNAETGVENVLLDRRLAIQAHHNRDLIDQHSVAKSDEALSTIAKLIGKPNDLTTMQEAFTRLRAGSTSESFFVSMNGHRRIVGAAYISGLQWYALSILDLDQVIGKHLFLPILVLAVAVMLLLVSVVALAVNRLLLEPLAGITTSVQRLAEGDYSLELPLTRRDEIGALARTFSQMSDKIHDHTENLERLVEQRTAQLQEKADHLKEALDSVRTLEGILPICASCKKIRDDQGYWTQVEAYVSQRTSARFTHGVCPECAKKLYPGHLKDPDDSA